jgi:Domain of unknown function (DUF1906)
MIRKLSRGRRMWGVVTALVLAASLTPLLGAQAAQASLPGPVVQKGEGFDTAALPTTAEMSDWWYDTPYNSFGFYLGGENSGGTNPGHDWLAAVMTDGFGVMPIWVGPQSACVDQSGLATFSNTPATALAQGEAQANAAVAAAEADGFANFYVYYDLEGFNTSNSTCVTAAEMFVNGFEYEIHTVDGKHGGVYGSSCASDLSAYTAHSNVPEAIWAADYGTSDYATSPLDCIANNEWDHDQRLHQWSGNTLLRYLPGDSGTEIDIDEDCVDGPTQRVSAWSESCQ